MYRIFVEIHGRTVETNITDLITGNGCEGYEGEPRNVLVSGARSPGASESRAVLNA